MAQYKENVEDWLSENEGTMTGSVEGKRKGLDLCKENVETVSIRKITK